MVKQQLEQLFGKQDNIRLVSVIAHVDHGKTTLTDSLLAKAGIIDQEQAGNKRGTDTMDEEKQRGITIRSTGVTMTFDSIMKKDDECVLHLVDSPGHVDFSSEVTAALRVSDGAIVVVDCVEGVCVQTETVLRQALTERVKPILVLNKVDRAVLELQLSPEDAYVSFCKTINAVNDVLSSYADPVLGDISFAPEKGNVVFASGLFGWGVSLPQFAKRLASKGSEGKAPDEQVVAKMVKNLWGEAYFDPETKKIVHSVPPGKKLERYACKMFLAPIFKLVKAVTQNDWVQIDEMLPRIDVTLLAKDRERTGKDLMKTIMRRFLPLADSLLDVVFTHLPSPLVAQKYRTEILYDGDLNDEYATAIRDCNPNGPLVAFISKMFPVPNTKAFYAFGRVFSGTVRYGQKIYALGGSTSSKKEDNSKNVQRLLPMSIRTTDNLEYCVCGNIVALQGIDSLLTKCGTISSSPQASPIKAMKFSVSPVVRAAVSCKNPQDLPKLLEGLRALVNADSCVQLITEKDSSELIIGAAGDLHLQVCMSVLRNDYCKGMEILESPPMVPFRETVTTRSSEVILVKSPNKHNRIYAEAVPLSQELCTAIDDKLIPINEDSKNRSEMLINQFGWDDVDAKKKIWCFAPETQPTNTVVDTTKAVQYLNEIKDSVVGAFRWGSEEGPLCGEPLRGVRINIVDVTLHADAIHRGGGQILPIVRRMTHACVLAGSPRLVEPMYLVEIVTTQTEAGRIYSVIERRRGRILSEEPRFGTPMCTLRAHLPVLESFGLTATLREATHGQAFAQCSFSHWQILDEDPFKEGSLANQIVKNVRARKGLPPTLPKWQDLVDKL